MKLTRPFALCALLVALAIFSAACSKSEKTDSAADDTAPAAAEIDKAGIQAAMTAYVDAKLDANEAVYMIDDMSGTYDYLHEGVMEVDGHFVSCADVKVGEDVYDIDLVVAMADDGSYQVVKETLHMKNGEAVDKTLWEMAPMEEAASDTTG